MGRGKNIYKNESIEGGWRARHGAPYTLRGHQLSQFLGVEGGYLRPILTIPRGCIFDKSHFLKI